MKKKSKKSTGKKSKESTVSCWEGYERVSGKAPGTKGSCKKKGS